MDFEKLKEDLSAFGTIAKDAIDDKKLGIAMQLNEPFEENFNLAIQMINDRSRETYPNIETEAQKNGLLKAVLRPDNFKSLDTEK